MIVTKRAAGDGPAHPLDSDERFVTNPSAPPQRHSHACPTGRVQEAEE
jgi:hypothetical protein